MPTFEPVLLARIDKPNSTALAGYRADGGYEALEKSLAMAPDDVTKLVKDAGLRGRGGAGFSAGMKWSFLPKNHPGPIYLCVNADESEPGTFNNRILMEQDPHQLLEGIAIACHAIRSNTAYLYLRYEYGTQLPRARCGDQRVLRGRHAWARRFWAADFKLDVYLHRGAGAYICGEETGLIESLEGKRAWPRIKPPYPAIEGLFRKPTIVNNVETLCCVTHILARGGDWFKSIGVPPDPNNKRDQGSYGPKLYCISGHVNKPCCVELPLGVTTRELIDVHGGGVWKGRKAKAVVPGGISMGFLSANELDTKLDFEGPGKVGCLGLGHGGGCRDRRSDEHGRRALQLLPVHVARIVRPVHAVPRRHGLDDEDSGADSRGPREAGRHRLAARSRELDGDHSGHDDLRLVGRRGVAGEERDHEVPAASLKSTSAAGEQSITPAQELMTAH